MTREENGMGKNDEKKSFKISGRFELDKVTDFFHQLLDSMEQQAITLQHNDDEVELAPASIVEMAVQALQKNDREELTIDLRWERGKLDSPTETIGSGGEPAQEPQEAPKKAKAKKAKSTKTPAKKSTRKSTEKAAKKAAPSKKQTKKAAAKKTKKAGKKKTSKKS
jgi:amphi-Trp domain-containing protein